MEGTSSLGLSFLIKSGSWIKISVSKCKFRFAGLGLLHKTVLEKQVGESVFNSNPELLLNKFHPGYSLD